MNDQRDPPRVRVAHLIHCLHVGGLEQLVVELADRGRAHGIDPLLLALGADGPVRDLLVQRAVPVTHLGDLPGLSLAILQRIHETLDDFGVQVAHAHDVGPWLNVVAARVLCRRPTVVATFHQLAVPQGRRRRAAVIAAHLTEAMVACGEEVRTALETWAPRSARLYTIGNGVALPPPCTEASRRAARARLGLPSEAVVVGFVGRLHEEKGPDRLLKAFLARFQGAPHVHLALVGAGPLDAKLRARAAGAANVHFAGEVVEAATLLPGFDLYAQPSLREGRSLSMLEAMAAGLPTIAHDLPAVCEIHDPGRTALLVAVGDAHGLEKALALLVTDPQRRRELGARARQSSQRFSVDTMVEAYASLYRAAAARGAAR